MRGPFDKQHGKRTQALLKPALQHLYHINWSLARKLCWKKSLLLTWKILVLLVSTLAAVQKYLVLNRDNLKVPIQMQLSQKQKTFPQFMPTFLKSIFNFKHFKKKMTLIAFTFLKLRTRKRWLDKCLKSPFSDYPSTSNIVNVPKHCWNMRRSTFIRYIDHCKVNRIEKSLPYWNAKSWYCLLTHWLPIKSILFLIETN